MCVCVCVCVHIHPTLCNPLNCSSPGSSVRGILLGKNTGVGSHFLGFPGGISGKEAACHRRRHETKRFGSWVEKIPWRREMATLQYSCLGNPMDRGAWRATVFGVAKSQTWLDHTHTICYSRGSSQPRDQTHVSCVSCIGRWRHYHCTTWEPSVTKESSLNLLGLGF